MDEEIDDKDDAEEKSRAGSTKEGFNDRAWAYTVGGKSKESRAEPSLRQEVVTEGIVGTNPLCSQGKEGGR